MKENELKLVYLDHRGVAWVYYIFQTLIILTMLGSIISIMVRPEDSSNQVNHIILCVLALLLFNVPAILKTKFKIYIPSIIQVVALIFIYCHFVLGEIFRLFDYSIYFDKILHTTSGIALTILGFSLLNFLNKSETAYIKLTPFFVAFFSFCFALAIGLLWEVFEFLADSLVGSNMQRWQLDADVLATQAHDLGRFGLMDTMIDLIVSTIGSLVVSVICYISLKTKKDFLNRVMFRRIVDVKEAIESARLVGDERLVEILERAMRIQQQKKLKAKTKV